jgi:uncharacterized membrane protein HdeD (DUF308 family)
MFIKNIAKLSVPTLALRSALYVLVGVLLLSRFAPYVLVIGLGCYAAYQGYRTIHGAFSLKNEGLSYIGYMLIGLAVIGLGWALVKHPQLSLKIAVFITCFGVIAYGMMRLIVALFWASKKRLKAALFSSGLLMIAAGVAAIAGSIASVYAIVYVIAIIIIAKGCIIAWYAALAFAIAYIRGYDYKIGYK